MSLLEISKSVSDVAFVVQLALVSKKIVLVHIQWDHMLYLSNTKLHYLVIRLSTFKDLILVIRNT